LGCGARDDQNRLIRLVVTDQATLKIDKQASGRGGYLHPVQQCWQTFVRRKSLYRAFRKEIKKEAKEKLIQDLKERH
jgi:predicted RNA-binding protein YlxR (DUF448 family)